MKSRACSGQLPEADDVCSCIPPCIPFLCSSHASAPIVQYRLCIPTPMARISRSQSKVCMRPTGVSTIGVACCGFHHPCMAACCIHLYARFTINDYALSLTLEALGASNADCQLRQLRFWIRIESLRSLCIRSSTARCLSHWSLFLRCSFENLWLNPLAQFDSSGPLSNARILHFS